MAAGAPAPVVAEYHLDLRFDGAPVPESAAILSIETDHTYNRPATCTVVFSINFLGEEPSISVGAAMTAKMSPEPAGAASAMTIFEGEVISTELDYDGTFSTFAVHGVDQLHRLFRDDRTKAWVDVKTSDIASAIAGAHGLSGDVADTSAVHKILNQYNETDGDFLSRLATQAGCSFRVEEKKLILEKHDRTASPVRTLTYGESLLRFNMRATTSSTLQEVEVRSWDPVMKEEVVGKQAGTEVNPANAMLGKAGDGKTMLVRSGTANALEANAAAASWLANEGSHEIQAACYGTKLSPGEFVDFKNIGQKLSGTYRVNRVQQSYAAGNFITEFWCGAPRAVSLGTLVAQTAGSAGGATASPTRDSFTAPTIAIVSNNNDEEGKMGRVKVKFPQLDNAVESDWMRVVYPGAGKSRGLQLVPEVNDEVLVVFADGDNRTGYVIGGLYNGIDAPPFPNDMTSGAVRQKGYYSRLGAFLMFDDDQDLIQVQTSDQNVDLVMKKGGGLVVTSKAGNVITMTAEGAITVESTSGNIALKAAAGDITLDAQNIKLTASVNLDAKASAKLNLEGTGGAAMKGATATVEGQSTAELKGALTTVSASGITEVKGSLVKIN